MKKETKGENDKKKKKTKENTKNGKKYQNHED